MFPMHMLIEVSKFWKVQMHTTCQGCSAATNLTYKNIVHPNQATHIDQKHLLNCQSHPIQKNTEFIKNVQKPGKQINKVKLLNLEKGINLNSIYGNSSTQNY